MDCAFTSTVSAVRPPIFFFAATKSISFVVIFSFLCSAKSFCAMQYTDLAEDEGGRV